MNHGACIPQRVHTVVVSVQHSEKISLNELREEILNKVIKSVIPPQYLDNQTIVHINPCGLFIIGGPQVRLIEYAYVGLSSGLKNIAIFKNRKSGIKVLFHVFFLHMKNYSSSSNSTSSTSIRIYFLIIEHH